MLLFSDLLEDPMTVLENNESFGPSISNLEDLAVHRQQSFDSEHFHRLLKLNH